MIFNPVFVSTPYFHGHVTACRLRYWSTSESVISTLNLPFSTYITALARSTRMQTAVCLHIDEWLLECAKLMIKSSCILIQQRPLKNSRRGLYNDDIQVNVWVSLEWWFSQRRMFTYVIHVRDPWPAADYLPATRKITRSFPEPGVNLRMHGAVADFSPKATSGPCYHLRITKYCKIFREA